ncbi:hypothetical protein OAN61_01170 [bacterium]|nr:hypothetical protein [bacterium]
MSGRYKKRGRGWGVVAGATGPCAPYRSDVRHLLVCEKRHGYAGGGLCTSLNAEQNAGHDPHASSATGHASPWCGHPVLATG